MMKALDIQFLCLMKQGIKIIESLGEKGMLYLELRPEIVLKKSILDLMKHL